MVGGPARFRWHSALEAEPGQVQFINEGVDDANQVVLVDVIIDALRQEKALRPVPALDVTRHGPAPLPNIVAERCCQVRLGLGTSFGGVSTQPLPQPMPVTAAESETHPSAAPSPAIKGTQLHNITSTPTAPAPSGANTASLDALASTIRGHLERGQTGGLDALRAFRDMGEALNEAKSILPKGKFGPWTEAQFGFVQQWRSRLMALATRWPAVLDALEWAKRSGRVLGRTEYGVNGALALAAEHARASDPEAAAKAAEKRAKAKAGAVLRLASKDALAAAQEELAVARGEADTLRKELAEAKECGAKLQARINDLYDRFSIGTPKPAVVHSWDQPAPSATGEAGTVTPGIKAKAKKAHGFYRRGACEAERQGAKARLEDMAARVGMTFEAFLTECGFPL